MTHSIATMAGRLRDEPGSVGLVSANGGFITKHAFGVYGTEPPATPFQHADVQAEVDALPEAGAVRGARRRGRHRDVDRDARPRRQPGERASSSACSTTAAAPSAPPRTPTLLKVLVTEDLAGRRARVAPDGATELL